MYLAYTSEQQELRDELRSYFADLMTPELEEELAGALQHLRIKKRCIWCDIIRQERQEGGRVILDQDGFMALSPFAPRFPFETWILPTVHRSRYEDTPPGDFARLAAVVRQVLGRMGELLDDPPYNFMLHSAPLRAPALDHFHWHLEIIPKLTRVAGFEWGTVFYINPTPPEEAARFLRNAPTKVSMPDALPAWDGELGFVYVYVGAPDRVLDHPERLATANRLTPPAQRHLWSPEFAPVRKTERFKAFARAAHYVDYWRARGWPDHCHPVGADDFECD